MLLLTVWDSADQTDRKNLNQKRKKNSWKKVFR